jgi:hypothetical protein
MNLIKPSTGCNISVDQTLDFVNGNNILFTVTKDGAELVNGNVVAVAKWLCTASSTTDINVPNKFVIGFAKMALDSVS